MKFQIEKQDVTQFNETGRSVLNGQLSKLWSWLNQFAKQETSADITIYVDAANGKDTNKGTAAAPLKTIQSAKARIPGRVNHAVKLVLIGTFSEALALTGYSSSGGAGSIAVYGASESTADGTKATVTRVQEQNCSIPISCYNLTASTADSIAYYALDSKRINLFHCTATASTGSQTGVYSVDAEVRMESCTISNKYRAIYANLMGRIYSYSTGGIGNTYGLVAAGGGTIYKGNTTQPAATTAETYASGGRIVSPT